MNYLLGIDFGGGSSKATLIDRNGVLIAEKVAEYPTYYPQLGYCEQAPADWKQALIQNIRSLLESSGVHAKEILALAIDSATHTAVVCDEQFKVLRPAIHWTDSRCADICRELCERYGEIIFEKTFHKPDTIWTLPQFVWLKRNEPQIFEKIAHVFFEKDYIRYLLTGVWCTDEIEAQGSMLFDCRHFCWDETLCEICSLPISALPPVVKPTDQIGTLTKEAADFTGLCEGMPVICGTTDTAMEVFAASAVEKGDVTVKLATAGRICVMTDRAYPDRDFVNYSHIVPGLWYPGTATKAAASSYRWYRDTFGGDYESLNQGAASVELGCNGLMYHPYINGELTPYADPLLCGSFTGIRATHTRGHFTRAVMEGVALSLLHCKQKLLEAGIPVSHKATLIGGGAKGVLWRQITADALGMELVLTQSSDSSLGSAMLAGLSTGVFADAKEAVKTCIKPIQTIEPNPEKTLAYERIFKDYVRIHDALAPIYDDRK